MKNHTTDSGLKSFKGLFTGILSICLVLGFFALNSLKAHAEAAGVEIIVEEDGSIIDADSETGEPLSKTDVVYLAYDDGEEGPWFWVCDEADDWVISYDYKTMTFGLRNFKYEGEHSPFNFYGYEGTVTIALEGDNEIIMTGCDGLETQGSLVFEGKGNLVLENKNTASVDEEGNPLLDEEGNKIVPAALFVGLNGKEDNEFINHCTGTITCKSVGDVDFNLGNIFISNVINTGNVKGQGVVWGVDGVFTDLVPYTTTYTEPKREGFEIKGKAYYYDDSDNTLWPNNICGTLGESSWRYVGSYDEEGRPIASNDFYQNYMVNERGVWLTMDFDNQYAFLVYGTTKEVDALPTPDDIVSVQDSEEDHTFNTDLYWALMVEGSMTVNGSITGELTLMENSYHTDIDYDKDAFAYERDENGNIVFMNDSKDAKAVINGDIGFLALNKSYKGDATINGKLMGIAYQDDVNVKDYEQPAWTAYAASAKAGQLVAKGSFTPGTIQELEGYKEIAVYDGEYCYVMTERKLDGEEVVGTTAVVGDKALLVDISKEELPEDTHPLVHELDEKGEKEVLDKLPETGDVLVMDISLIEANSKETEPDKAVNLYFDNLDDFESPVVYHVKDDGTVEVVYEGDGSFDGSLKLNVEGFSVYVIADKADKKADEVIGTKYSTYEGNTFYKDDKGDVRAYDKDGKLIRDEFKCDGTYTYYLQFDGTAMKDRLTYHPDGVHIIYLDSEGHEVFSDFAHVKKSIAGEEVDDFCFFDVFGYMYVDKITWDKTGTVLYYANPYGVMEVGKWFQFSDTVTWGDGTECEGIAGGYGYASEDATLMRDQYTYDWEGRFCYMQGNGVALY